MVVSPVFIGVMVAIGESLGNSPSHDWWFIPIVSKRIINHKPWRPWRWTLMRWSSEFHEAEANGHPLVHGKTHGTMVSMVSWGSSHWKLLKLIEDGSQLVFWSWKLENDEDLKLVWHLHAGKGLVPLKMCILVAPADCCPRIGRRETLIFHRKNLWFLISLDWFKGKSTGNHGFYH